MKFRLSQNPIFQVIWGYQTDDMMTPNHDQTMTTEQRQQTPICDTFIVLNEKGLHTRPSTELVKCAMTFHAEITLHHHNRSVNAKSLLGILTLGATRGARITIEAVGEDAEEAIATLKELAENKFYIHY